MPKRFASIAPLLVLAILAADLSAQFTNYLEPDLRKWSIQSAPNTLKLDVTASRISLRWILGGQRYSTCAISTKFTVPTTGAYALKLNAEVNYGGSRDDATWLIPGVAMAKWRQRDHLGCDVAMWVVPLQAKKSYDLHVLVPIQYAGTSAYMDPASLVRVELPALQPLFASHLEGSFYGSFDIVSERVLSKPRYLVVAHPQLLVQPVTLPFGALWLQQPLPIWFLDRTRWSPQNSQQAYDAYRHLTVGLYWQVLEFDAARPAGTMRLGSPVRLRIGSTTP